MNFTYLLDTLFCVAQGDVAQVLLQLYFLLVYVLLLVLVEGLRLLHRRTHLDLQPVDQQAAHERQVADGPVEREDQESVLLPVEQVLQRLVYCVY